MPEHQNITAEQVMQAVIRCRQRDHACTLGSLSKELDLSQTATNYWIKKLLASNVLHKSDVAGSLHVR